MHICIYTPNGVLFSLKEEWSYVICRKTDGTGKDHIKRNKSDLERQTLHVFSHMWNLSSKTDMIHMQVNVKTIT
jgi:hypothetical protein